MLQIYLSFSPLGIYQERQNLSLFIEILIQKIFVFRKCQKWSCEKNCSMTLFVQKRRGNLFSSKYKLWEIWELLCW